MCLEKEEMNSTVFWGQDTPLQPWNLVEVEEGIYTFSFFPVWHLQGVEEQVLILRETGLGFWLDHRHFCYKKERERSSEQVFPSVSLLGKCPH